MATERKPVCPHCDGSGIDHDEDDRQSAANIKRHEESEGQDFSVSHYTPRCEPCKGTGRPPWPARESPWT